MSLQPLNLGEMHGVEVRATACTPPLDPVEVEDALRRAYLARRSPIGTELAAPTVVVDL